MADGSTGQDSPFSFQDSVFCFGSDCRRRDPERILYRGRGAAGGYPDCFQTLTDHDFVVFSKEDQMAISPYYLIPPLPEEMEGVAEVGLDLRWSWSHETDSLWELIDPELWRLTRNPWFILQPASRPWPRLSGRR